MVFDGNFFFDFLDSASAALCIVEQTRDVVSGLTLSVSLYLELSETGTMARVLPEYKNIGSRKSKNNYFFFDNKSYRHKSELPLGYSVLIWVDSVSNLRSHR